MKRQGLKMPNKSGGCLQDSNRTQNRFANQVSLVLKLSWVGSGNDLLSGYTFKSA